MCGACGDEGPRGKDSGRWDARGVELGPLWEDAGTRDTFTDLDWTEYCGERHFADLLGSERGVCLLAEGSGVTVGYLAGYVRAPDPLRPVAVAELERMYVREGSRARGVGAGLARGFLGWAARQGAERASVNAYASNGRAIRFYSEMGFRPKSLTLEMGVPRPGRLP